IPAPEIGEEMTYFRDQKIWQYRPSSSIWVIRKGTDIYTYKRFHHITEGPIYENIAMLIPAPEIGEEMTYFRDQKIWQYRPSSSIWVIRKG
ncbi:hypothetical protein, partial [Chryseobacterium sp. CH1]|uniref:hypothetical protein n=1 Tax=Chryseobacterium sp. CH1 TaxID=713551 RepID=UPI0013E927A4